MKKSSFMSMILGTSSGVLFSLGMCMTLLPEWNAWYPGIIFVCAGIFLGIVTWIVWRKMERKPPMQFSRKSILALVVSITGTLAFGVGMCLCMIWNQMTFGILVGLVGIVGLLCLIPLFKGIK
ncbi:MAG: hypothetical protein HFJ84_04725 [Clostridiales bacterium]|jgi:hypothetical protein|nr:hypothetical protein [Clostridiales bacterium]